MLFLNYLSRLPPTWNWTIHPGCYYCSTYLLTLISLHDTKLHANLGSIYLHLGMKNNYCLGLCGILLGYGTVRIGFKKYRLNYASLTFTDTGNSRTAPNGYRTLEEIPVATSPTTPCGFEGSLVGDGRQSADYQIESMCTDMSYISSSPNTATGNGPGFSGTNRDRRSSCASSTWGGGDRDGNGHYRGDYHHVEVRPIRSVDLLGWAFQMARGMEYLASRKVERV